MKRSPKIFTVFSVLAVTTLVAFSVLEMTTAGAAAKTASVNAANAKTWSGGEQVFLQNPVTAPVHVNDNRNHRYYACEGNVNPQFIEITFNHLANISKAEGVSMPQKNLCLLSLNSRNEGDVLYYVSTNHMNQCLRDSCYSLRIATAFVAGIQYVLAAEVRPGSGNTGINNDQYVNQYCANWNDTNRAIPETGWCNRGR